MTSRFKKILFTSVLLVSIVGIALILHTAYAGGGAPSISLNSPVSFPVDI